ncbi:uncharacterized protein LOC135927638 isoform X2 [Gordionus sp. m RMFG-2023]|uniref:uncharacterized protein LOC135927638 isoform X2 n=1 Tax=Gordionus sp. m RMFG-2023 TaxID=3053472 RepID=UPI0031FC3D53
MFSKNKRTQSPLLKSKHAYSLDYLKLLYNILLKNQIITEENKDLLIETLRSISELLIWGDQNDPSLFDFFLEKNMLLFFISFAKQDLMGGKYLSVQLLQTLNILFENIRSDTSLYYLLSNNHINTLIQHNFDFTQEEIVGYYISFLKTLSMKLNQHTIHFFINEHSNEFPLYAEAIKFYKSTEPMVRIAVQTITLNIFSIKDKNARQQITKCSATYFYDLSSSLESNILNINSALAELTNRITNILTEISSDRPAKMDVKICDENVKGKIPEKGKTELNEPELVHDGDKRIKKGYDALDLRNILRKNCTPLLEKLNDLTIDHLDKLHYIYDIFECSGNKFSALTSLLSEILVNNVFVPLYLVPLSPPHNHSPPLPHHIQSDMDRRDGIPHTSAKSMSLTPEVSLFLLTQCFEIFGSKQHQCIDNFANMENEKSIHASKLVNSMLQELIDLVFINPNPLQIIMYCCDIRKSFSSSLIQTFDSGNISLDKTQNMANDPKMCESFADFGVLKTAARDNWKSGEDLLSSKSSNDLINAEVYQNIVPDDKLSMSCLSLGHKDEDYLYSLKKKLNPIYKTLLRNFDMVPNNANEDGRILLILIFISTVLSDSNISDLCFNFNPSMMYDIPLGIKTREISDFSGLKINTGLMMEKLINFIFDYVIKEYTGMRLVTLSLALSNLVALLARYTVDPDLYVKKAGKEKAFMMDNGIDQLIEAYDVTLTRMVNAFKSNEEVFTDVFEIQLASLVFLLIPSLLPFSTNQTFQSDNQNTPDHLKISEKNVDKTAVTTNIEVSLFHNPILLLTHFGLGDDRNLDKENYLNIISNMKVAAKVYDTLLNDCGITREAVRSSNQNHEQTLSNLATLYAYGGDSVGEISPTLVKLKMNISCFLLLRKFFRQLSPHFYPLTQRLQEQKWAYEKSLQDVYKSSVLPTVDTVLDLSDKDIISCTLEKHMNQNLPYWFLVVSDFYFSLVIPHQKKMAHGIVKYIAPLKDIEIASIYNEPKSLHVRTQILFNHSSPSSLSHIYNQEVFDKIACFKAKLIFEDVIRCQAAKNCLLKGRASCRKIKRYLLSKLFQSSHPSYLPLPIHVLQNCSGTPNNYTDRSVDKNSSLSENIHRRQSLENLQQDTILSSLINNSVENNPFIFPTSTSAPPNRTSLPQNSDKNEIPLTHRYIASPHAPGRRNDNIKCI